MMQLNYWPSVFVCVGAQHTNQLRAAFYKVVGSNLDAAKYFFLYLNVHLGIAYGAKVGLKLRLEFMLDDDLWWAMVNYNYNYYRPL